MNTRFKALVVPALAFLVLAFALPAGAMASPDDVLRDCAEDGSIDRDYSRGDLRQARGQIETDFASYSDCDEIIDGRLAPQAGASGNDGGSGGSGTNGGGSGAGGSGTSGSDGSGDGAAAASPEEQRRRELARADLEEDLGERAFEPGIGAAITSGHTANGVPLPILLALIALGLLLAAGSALAIGKRNPAFMGALRRVPFPRRGS